MPFGSWFACSIGRRWDPFHSYNQRNTLTCPGGKIHSCTFDSFDPFDPFGSFGSFDSFG